MEPAKIKITGHMMYLECSTEFCLHFIFLPPLRIAHNIPRCSHHLKSFLRSRVLVFIRVNLQSQWGDYFKRERLWIDVFCSTTAGDSSHEDISVFILKKCLTKSSRCNLGNEWVKSNFTPRWWGLGNSILVEAALLTAVCYGSFYAVGYHNSLQHPTPLSEKPEAGGGVVKEKKWKYSAGIYCHDYCLVSQG